MHVEWQLALAFKALLFWRYSRVALHYHSLRKEFLLAAGSTDFLQNRLCFIAETGPEGAETNLDEGAIEEDLSAHVERADILCQMAHQCKVTSSPEVVLQRKEIDLAKHSTSPDDAFTVLEEVIAKGLNQKFHVPLLTARSNVGCQARWEGIPRFVFQDDDHLRGLEINML